MMWTAQGTCARLLLARTWAMCGRQRGAAIWRCASGRGSSGVPRSSSVAGCSRASASSTRSAVPATWNGVSGPVAVVPGENKRKTIKTS